MRIRAVVIQNYRVHRHLSVTFDERVTIIGGTNESGKSTLVEAVHRALFMRHKTGGAELDVMRSHFGGHPEVTLTFEVDGAVYSIRKLFRGASGSAVLEQPGKSPVQGDEAEAKLAELLGQPAVTRGWSENSWSHLWVWQGQAFEHPSASTNECAADIVDRFQRDGAAVVQQSALDTRLAQHFANAAAELFNKNGTPKKNSPLDVAMEGHAQAQQELQRRREVLERLFEAANRLELARNRLRELDDTSADRERELAVTRARYDDLQTLRSRAALEQKDEENAQGVRDGLEQRERDFEALRQQVALLQKQLAPAQQEAERLAAMEQDALQAVHATEQRLTQVDMAVRVAMGRKALAEAYAKRLAVVGQQRALEERAERVALVAQTIAKLQQVIAELPLVDAARSADIDTAARETDVAHATLRAIATRIELLSGDVVVTVSDRPLVLGTSQIITADADLVVAGGVTVRITPGGGASLAEAQQGADNARRRLEALLQQAGVPSAEAAREALSERTRLGNQLALSEQQLRELRPESIVSERALCEGHLAEAVGEIERRRAQGAELLEPDTTDDAQRLELEERESHRRLEEEQSRSVTDRTHTRQLLDDAREGIRKYTDSMEAQHAELKTAEDQLASQLRVHGSDVKRAATLAEARTVHQRYADTLASTSKAMRELEPESIDLSLRMLTSSVGTLQGERRAAEHVVLIAQRDLEQDGSRDPHAEVAIAEARERELASRLARERLQADAVRELRDLYESEQKQLAEEFSRPLCERVNEYLRVVMPDSALQVTYDRSSFTDTQILRGAMQTGFRFDTLSIGAREQVATALRLGVAEVLAAGHHGTLPVVFDDAFAYSDPERVKRLQRMLFLAAERGLQVIVLSCNPAEYDGIGTRITLERPVSLSLVPLVDMATASVDTPDMVEQGTDDESEPDGDPGDGDMHDGDAEIFLDILANLGGKAGNQSLRLALGWEEDRYDTVRTHLRNAGRVSIGRGRGGSVILTGPALDEA
jgi:hypothetical protein